MPVEKSYVFASNRGGAPTPLRACSPHATDPVSPVCAFPPRARTGVGKTTCVTQLAATYADEHPDINVLVVDFSIHGDSTSQLLGAFPLS